MATKTTSGGSAGVSAEEGGAPAKKGGGMKKLIIIIVPVVLVAVGVTFFLTKGSGGGATAKPTETPKPTPGTVKVLDPVTINLAGAHYLKLGIGLQQSAAVAEEVDGSKALDDAIELFSGMTIKELSTKKGRDAAKAELVKEIKESYKDEKTGDSEVYDIYFTTFVMQ
jgi:flagellar FliL protein